MNDQLKLIITSANILLPILGWIVIIWNSRLLMKRAEIRDICKEAKSIIDMVLKSGIEATENNVSAQLHESSITALLANFESLYEHALKSQLKDPIQRTQLAKLRHRSTFDIEALAKKTPNEKKKYIDNISEQCRILKSDIDVAFASKYWKINKKKKGKKTL